MITMEEWREVLNGYYAVSTLGNVKRIKHVKNETGERPIKLNSNGRGYYAFTSCICNVRKTQLVHRLVCKAFLGDPNGLDANHKDGNKLNNNILNLEYVTEHENCIHASKMGLCASGDRNGMRKYPERVLRGLNHWTAKKPECKATGDRHGSHVHPERWTRGEKSNLSKLKESEVVKIKIMHRNGDDMFKIANMFNVSVSCIRGIVIERNWKHVKIPDEYNPQEKMVVPGWI